ncbi:DUF2949 domain-containing protein [Synechococcus sp. HJ21-Hayes]|jgi:hypothetical protein|uniref:DUF2949 domain-containing protein n=1 Tax=unclassified Synechococcus TaxID=2626047 RepID=UPI0020CDE748|nr:MULTISPECIES: DUF2949 domain-containing protein [unclassified Synechococcus]MCP9832339.1 DUF2949 domain-containing protein [Synechococcus sp. JJ3a-Johnson]MCP9853925.1 DUF2949 domain-containing protein [Synechococcus sp. HJ21-Hayes]
MVISTSPQPPPSPALLRYLRQELAMSDSALGLGLKQAQLEQAPLPVVLWRFGLISLEQLDQVLVWLTSTDL